MRWPSFKNACLQTPTVEMRHPEGLSVKELDHSDSHHSLVGEECTRPVQM